MAENLILAQRYTEVSDIIKNTILATINSEEFKDDTPKENLEPPKETDEDEILL
jgi:hypothetical protein